MEKGKKGFLAEFREFISRGSVTDLAVGVIVGSAFTAIVNSLVNDMLMPLIGLLVGGYDFSGLKVVLSTAADGTENAFRYGAFLQSVVNFLIIAFAVFWMAKGINALRRIREREKKAREEKAVASPEQSEQVRLLTEIRDLLKR